MDCLFVRPYKNTGKWAAYYFGPEGHVYKDGRFDTARQCCEHFQALGFRTVISWNR